MLRVRADVMTSALSFEICIGCGQFVGGQSMARAGHSMTNRYHFIY